MIMRRTSESIVALNNRKCVSRREARVRISENIEVTEQSTFVRRSGGSHKQPYNMRSAEEKQKKDIETGTPFADVRADSPSNNLHVAAR